MRRFRTAQGLSQSQLAERMGGGALQQTVARVESGVRTLKYTEAVAIADALNIHVGQLAEGGRRASTDAALLSRIKRLAPLWDIISETAAGIGSALVNLAEEVGLNRVAPAEYRASESVAEDAEFWVGEDLGAQLNTEILRSIQNHPLAAGISADTPVAALAALMNSIIEWRPGIDAPGPVDE